MREFDPIPEGHPDAVTLGAWFDGELTGAAAHAIANHLAHCPTCRARRDAFAALRAGLSALADDSALGCDLSGAIDGRLVAVPSPPRPSASPWQGWWLPLGATLSVAAGFGLGAALSGAAAAPATHPLQAFATVPPGGLCLGLDACYAPATGARR